MFLFPKTEITKFPSGNNMKRAGLALVNMLFFVTVMTILAGVVMSLAGTNTRTLENHIRRMKAYYACQAGIVYRFDIARRTMTPATGVIPPSAAPLSVVWNLNANPPLSTKVVTFTSVAAAAPMPVSIYRFTATCDYSQT